MKRAGLAVAVMLALVVRPASAGEGETTAFYKAIAELDAARQWRAVIDQLGDVHHDYMDYRFFYFRARAYYGSAQIVAGDADAKIARVWATAVPEPERKTILQSLDASAAAAPRPSCKIDIQGVHGLDLSGRDR